MTSASAQSEPGCPGPILVLGPNASAAEVTKALDSTADATCIVLTSRDRIADFQELLDADRVFYLACGELSPRDLDVLIASANGARQRSVSLDRYVDAGSLRRVAVAQSVVELADALRTTVARAVDAEHTRCVFFDRERQLLWEPRERDGENASVGLVSFVLRTGTSVCVARTGDDPRFDLDLDGEPSDRFLAVPVHANGAVMAVLAATRAARDAAFEPVDVAAMEAIASHASPYIAAWLFEPEIDGPFRYRALREQQQPSNAPREPLHLEAVWMQRATWLSIVALLAFLIAFVLWKGWLA